MKPITITAIHLYPIAMPYLEPLRTSFGQEPFKAAVIIEVVTREGSSGWGEASVEINPGYGSETMGTGYHVLQEFLLPLLLGQTITSPTEVPAHLKSVRGNKHAKHGLEAAVWDAFARVNALRLADLLAAYLPAGHASKGYAWVGVSIGIQPTLAATLEIIHKRLAQGYERIKLKIKPGWDVELARGIRQALPDVMLMLDANSAYTLADVAHLQQLDAFDLLMIEQPLGDEDIYQHSQLQPQLTSRICLDESIKSADDLRLALQLGALRVLNLKPARVGGFTECLEIYRVCVAHDLPLWIGGMLETGIGRAANVALASLPGVTLPCDISATDRYFDPDLTEPPFVLQPGSRLAVPAGAGIGVTLQRERLQAAVAQWETTRPYSLG
ncbi:MAG: o-succinylbenzoate synthase [Anaerolineae bacterium]|nr:o-succinylbenzoate synthase [Anaerolineae bacterium]